MVKVSFFSRVPRKKEQRKVEGGEKSSAWFGRCLALQVLGACLCIGIGMCLQCSYLCVRVRVFVCKQHS